MPDAKGSLDGLSATLAAGDGVFMGQTVITGNKGQVQIVFSDNTHLVVGPQASLVISEYLMRNTGSASKVVVDALPGTFRFMTGNSPKSAYQIKTPTGTLGVRGTAFDFTVDPLTGETTVLLYHGGVSMCDDHGCTDLAENCAVGVIANRNSPAVVGSHDRRRLALLGDFPYLASQSPLKAAFRVKEAAPCNVPQTTATFGSKSIVAAASEIHIIDPPPSEPPKASSSKPLPASSSQQPPSDPSSQPPPHGRPSHQPPPTSSEPPPTSSDPAPESSEPPPTSSEPPPASSEPPPAASEPPPTSTEPPPSEPNNNGLGNGGEGNEGPSETNNPGQGNGNNGNPGNGNGNGGVGNGNGNGNAKH